MPDNSQIYFPSDEPDEIMRRIFSASNRTVEYCTVPIAFCKDNKTEADRTGVLLAIGELYFLITAEHGLEDLANAGYNLYIPTQRPGIREVPICNDKVYVSHDPTVDLAFFKLEKHVAEQLLKDYRFLRLDQVRLHPPTPSEGPLFLVTGYPSAKRTRDKNQRLRLDVGRHITTLYKGDHYNLENYSPESHIILDYNKEAHHLTGGTRRPTNAPGLSGCGIWYLPMPDGPHLWTENDMYLAGIQTSWSKKGQYLKGTVISHALTMISGWFSDTRDIIRMHGLE